MCLDARGGGHFQAGHRTVAKRLRTMPVVCVSKNVVTGAQITARNTAPCICCAAREQGACEGYERPPITCIHTTHVPGRGRARKGWIGLIWVILVCPPIAHHTHLAGEGRGRVSYG